MPNPNAALHLRGSRQLNVQTGRRESLASKASNQRLLPAMLRIKL
jgi:hypothetical protein